MNQAEAKLVIQRQSQISRNFREFRKIFARIPDGRYRRYGDILLLDSGVPVPSWNGIILNPAAFAQIGEYSGDIKEFFAESISPLSCWLCPGTDEAVAEGTDLLSAFSHPEKLTAMAIDLEKQKLIAETPVNLRIEPVRDYDQVEITQKIIRTSFGLPFYCRDALHQVFYQNLSSNNGSLFLYNAYWDGIPAGSAALFLTDDVAGLYFIGTLPDWRVRGIGSALTHHCLQEARRLEKRVAVLYASPLGKNIYLKMGFQEFGFFTKLLWTRHVLPNFFWKLNYLFKSAVDKFMRDAIWFC